MKKAYLICAINPLSYQYPKTVFLFLCENKTHPLRAVSSQLFRLCPPKAVIILNIACIKYVWTAPDIFHSIVPIFLFCDAYWLKTSIPHFRQVQAGLL